MFGITGMLLAFGALAALVSLSAALGWVCCAALVTGHRGSQAVLLLAIWALVMWFVVTTTARSAGAVGVLFYLAGFVSVAVGAVVARHELLRWR